MAAPLPIPLALVHRPVSAGLVVPYVSVRRDDGVHILGVVDAVRKTECLVRALCQICGHRLEKPMVFLLRERDLTALLPGMVVARSWEPAMHPVCAAYSIQQCPMLAGRMEHHRSTPHPINADPQRPVRLHAADTSVRLGKPAESWVEVWIDSYTLDRDGGEKGVSARLSGPARRVRALAEHPLRRAAQPISDQIRAVHAIRGQS
jgi:hypothetical protein